MGQPPPDMGVEPRRDQEGSRNVVGLSGIRAGGDQSEAPGSTQVVGGQRIPDLQRAWQVLLQCSGPRCHHTLRTMPPGTRRLMRKVTTKECQELWAPCWAAFREQKDSTRSRRCWQLCQCGWAGWFCVQHNEWPTQPVGLLGLTHCP